jgi:hypothetical protein
MEAHGARSQFYENMRRALPGDEVISYAAGVIANFGIVTDAALAAPKPDFGTKGAYWNNRGWLLPVVWRSVATPLKLSDVFGEVGELLPGKYSPVHPVTAKGNQKAYLAEVSNTLFAVIRRRAGPLLPENPDKRATGKDVQPTVDSRIEEMNARAELNIASPADLAGTEVLQELLARRGQGAFRRNVFSVEACCRCTGIGKPSLLIASHIKPWRFCETAYERLDGNNGLLLAPNADRLFDRGLMTFRDDGSTIFSNAISEDELRRLGIRGEVHVPLNPVQQKYMRFHRAQVFSGAVP